MLRLLYKFSAGRVAHLQKSCGGGVERDKQVAQMFGKSRDEMLSVEAFFDNLLIEQQTVGDVASPEIVHKTEIVLAVEHIEVFDAAFVSEVAVAEIHQLVKHRKCVAQAAFGFLGYNVQCFRLVSNTFLRSHILQMVGNILDFDAFEVENLATRQYCGNNLVFLGGGKYEFGVRRRLLQSFEECVESLLRQHVNLVDDVNLVTATLWRYVNLFHQLADVVNGVVGSGVELEHVEGGRGVERTAGIAFVACFHIVGDVGAVDGLGQNTGASGFAHATRTAEEECLSQLVVLYGVFQRCGDMLLPYHRFERHRTVLTC